MLLKTVLLVWCFFFGMFIKNYLCCFSLGVYSSELHIQKYNGNAFENTEVSIWVNRNASFKGKLAWEFPVEFFSIRHKTAESMISNV